MRVTFAPVAAKAQHRHLPAEAAMTSNLPRRRLILLAAAGLAATGALAFGWRWPAGLPDPADPRTTLAEVEAAVSRLLPVPEITPEGLARLMASGAPHVLFDVREPEEYAQSHIPGAIRLDPGADAATVLAAHGARMAGATVVFYCAVGWRSGVMVTELRRAAAEARAAALLNMRGGAFRWHAEGRPLAPDSAGVHHYDPNWGRLLERTIGG
jgi:rhodanese-related sulfurtransferase